MRFPEKTLVLVLLALASMGCGAAVPESDSGAAKNPKGETNPDPPTKAELEAMLSVDTGEWELVAYEAHELPPSAVGSLIELLEHTDFQVRLRAVHCLGWIGDPRAVEPLRGLLNNPDLRQDAVGALGELGDAAVPALDEALDSPDHETRRDAVVMLSRMGSDATIEALIHALTDEYEVVVRIARGALAQKACKDLGQNPDAWEKWWSDKEHRFDDCED